MVIQKTLNQKFDRNSFKNGLQSIQSELWAEVQEYLLLLSYSLDIETFCNLAALSPPLDVGLIQRYISDLNVDLIMSKINTPDQLKSIVSNILLINSNLGSLYTVLNEHN